MLATRGALMRGVLARLAMHAHTQQRTLSAAWTAAASAAAHCRPARCTAAPRLQLPSLRRPFSTATAATPSTTTASASAGASSANSGSSESSSNGSSSGSSSQSDGPDMNSDPLGSDKGIAWWLFGCSGLVFVMVSLGGLTRLTKSGLSMVEWKPTSFVPPRNEDEWRVEFEKYQQFPEYKRVNNQMSLSEFKFIYNMEFSHRLLGRTIGLAFAIPGVYFLARGRINRALGKRLGLAFAAGGAQGAIGWWMVRSGLENPHETRQSGQVHVSPYRLAAHLISAFAIYALLFSTALRVHPSTFTRALRSATGDVAALRAYAALNSTQRLRTWAAATTALVACTVFSGAFVAGNEAGLVYNEFPLMGGRLIPTDMISPYIDPVWRNAFENSTTVQWNHRVLAMTTAGVAVAAFAAVRRAGKRGDVAALIRSNLQVSERYARVRRAGHAVAGMVAVQVSLGVATLLLYVPVGLATAHQAGSLTLLTFALWLLHTTRNPVAPKHELKMWAEWARQQIKAGRKLADLPAPAAAALQAQQRAALLGQLRRGLADVVSGRPTRGAALAVAAVALAGGVAFQLSKALPSSDSLPLEESIKAVPPPEKENNKLTPIKKA